MPSVRIIATCTLGHSVYVDLLYAHMRSRGEFSRIQLEKRCPTIPERLFTNRRWPLGTPHSRQILYHQLRYLLRYRLGARFDIDYFHTQSIAGGALLSPAHVVVSIDTTGVLTEQMVGRAHDVSLFARERAIYQRADLVVAMCDWAARSAVRDYGVPPQSIAVIRNGMYRDSAVDHIGGGGWLFVGNDFRRKGGDIVLDVHQNVFHARPRLTIVTSPAAAGGVSGENVEVLHSVPHQQLIQEVFPRADVFVFPTREDYSPWVLLEAMWAGVPVVSTRVGAIPEMVRHGIDGWLVDTPTRESVAEALSREQQSGVLERMGKAARQRAEALYDLGANFGMLCDRLVRLA